MSDNKFKITYEVDDGYVGGARPHYLTLSEGDLNGDESDQDLKNMFWDEIQRHFTENCHPYSEQEEEFVAWAKQRNAEADHE